LICGAGVVADAKPWYDNYIAHSYKVKVKKPIKVMKIKSGNYTYENKVTQRFKWHKGEIVYAHFAGAGGMDWPIKGKKYKSAMKYGYSAHFTKESFKLLKIVKYY